MDKITEKLLLEKGSPKTNKLEQIKTLNLSRLGLNVKDLPVKLLSRLQSLERLDLSGNRLQEFVKNVELPALRYLDLSDNQMEDVTTLESLSGLEELKMDDNLYITVSDNYKLMMLLPNLRIHNGKDVSTTANHLRYVYSENLQTRITALWEKSFSLPDPITAKEMSTLEAKFVSTARQQVKYGPNSVSDFTKWRVGIMAKEYLRSLTEEKDEMESEESTDAKENHEVSTPAKRKQQSVSVTDTTDLNLTPRKKLRTDFPASLIKDSPCKSSPRLKLQTVKETSGVRMSPRKRDEPSTTPTRGQTRAETPGRGSKTRQTKEDVAQDVGTPSKNKRTILVMDDVNLTPRRAGTPGRGSKAWDEAQEATTPSKKKSGVLVMDASLTPRRAGTPGRGSKTRETKEDEAVCKKAVRATEMQRDAKMAQPVCLKPLHVLQCHSKHDNSEDFSTQLWACAFQPLPDYNGTGGGGGSRMVATCGGDSLCVIDCETGIVMKKYKVPGEEFFSLAWTTVLMSRSGGASAQHCSILAAGGKRGVVKLIHPRNNVAYGEFRASRKALSVVRFNPQQQSFLYTGSYDNKIVMWDIGGVDSQYNYKVVQLLMMEISATPLHICFPPTSPKTHILTGCEDGLYCFNTQLGTNNTTKRSKEMEINFPIYEKEDKDHDYHTIDGLSFLTDDIVASKNYMHGSIYLWSWSRTKAQRPDKKSKEVCAVLLAELQWTNTEIPYLALNTCPGRAYIACGDDKGRLWTYHVNNLQKERFQKGKPIAPTEVLEWPAPMKKDGGQVEGPSINSVAMDPELQYLVALSDKNMVMVWKTAPSS